MSCDKELLLSSVCIISWIIHWLQRGENYFQRNINEDSFEKTKLINFFLFFIEKKFFFFDNSLHVFWETFKTQVTWDKFIDFST